MYGDQPETFTITDQHLVLLKNFYVAWQDCEYGAPEINPKRPYGNSGVEEDICELLGWSKEGDDGDGKCWSSTQRATAAKLHRETKDALQICLCLQSFATGTYRKADRYMARSWEMISA